MGERERSGSTNPILEPVRRYFETPLVRNAFALIGNTGLTTVIGLVYWYVARREYAVDDIGRGQSLINLMSLLAGVGGLGLVQFMPRLLPRSGRRALPRILGAYAAAAAGCTVVILVVSTVLSGPLSGSTVSLTELIGPGTGPKILMWVAVVTWALFSLQDSVMTGLRRPVWIPVENAAHSFLKLVLVVVLASVTPRLGVFLSWVIPTALALIPITVLVVRGLVPRHQRMFRGEPEHFPPHLVRRIVSGEYLVSLFSMLIIYLVPLVVVNQFGLVVGAHFSIAWMIGMMMDQIVGYFGASLTVEGTLDQENLAELTRTLIRRSLVVVAPLAAVMVIAGPMLLDLYWGSSGDSAGTVLRLLGIALLPRLVSRVVGVIARIQRHVGILVAVEGTIATTTVVSVLVFAWTSRLTPTAVAAIYLGAVTAVAIVLLGVLLRFLRDGSTLTLRSGVASGSSDGLIWIDRHLP